jgi:hypothetical protein
MSIRRVERGEWSGFCIYASRVLVGKQVDMQVLSLQIGSQIEARRMPLFGMAYDPASDVLELLFGDELDHLIRAPRELYVDEGSLGIVSLQVVDSDGIRQIITLRDPLLLASPDNMRSG